MRSIIRSVGVVIAAAAAAFVGLPNNGVHAEAIGSGFGAKEFCENHNYSSDSRVSFNEIREFTLPATGSLSVDGDRNGGIAVKGGAVSAIEVRACVSAWGRSDDAARAVAGNININTNGTIKAENSSDESNWSVSYLITVPRSTSLQLTAKNGGISIAGVDGRIEFQTVNGGVSLKDVAGDVRGRTTNGGVNVVLGGSTWIGSGLDVTTTNGGVKLTLPSGYAANIETGTVNGGFTSDVVGLDIEKDDSGRHRAKRLNAALNGGGAPVKVMTTNGGIKITTVDGAFNY